MRKIVIAVLLAVVSSMPTPPSPPPTLPGTFVRFDEMERCPILASRPVPSRSDDVRPDDIRVVMALGDSITAAFLAKGNGWAIPWLGTEEGGWEGRPAAGRKAAERRDTWGHHYAQMPFSTFDVEEYRGVSYAIGGDPGAVTLPNILGHYSNLTGASIGHRPPVTCGVPGVSRLCSPHHEEDRFNAAVSGSTAAALVAEVQDYLVPTYLSGRKKDGWAFVNIGIGANDICAFCMTSTTPAGPGSPEEFARGIYEAVQLLRNRVPKLIVNIMGVLRVSAIYELTRKDPYCSGGLPIYHLPLECNCALLPGPVGAITRKRMDELADTYDKAVIDLIRAWDKEADETFAAIWQPGSAIDLANYPIQALSPADCFHPSEAAHQRLAAGLWNRLTMDMSHKSIPVNWEEGIYVRCLEEGDRILVGQL